MYTMIAFKETANQSLAYSFSTITGYQPHCSWQKAMTCYSVWFIYKRNLSLTTAKAFASHLNKGQRRIKIQKRQKCLPNLLRRLQQQRQRQRQRPRQQSLARSFVSFIDDKENEAKNHKVPLQKKREIRKMRRCCCWGCCCCCWCCWCCDVGGVTGSVSW